MFWFSDLDLIIAKNHLNINSKRPSGFAFYYQTKDARKWDSFAN